MDSLAGKGTPVLARVPNAVYPLNRMLRALLFLVLAASLTANVWFYVHSRPTAAAASAGSEAAPKPKATPAVSTPDPNAANFAAPLALQPTTAAEFKEVRSRLESLGLPPQVVRTVLAMLLHRSFQARFAALQQQPGPEEYWRNPGSRHVDSNSPAFRELANEQRQLMRELVGHEADLDDDARRRQFGGLPAAKVAPLLRIMSDYAELEEQLHADGTDRNPSDSRARAALLAREKRADIERLLTPEELLNYDLRNSPAAHRLRGQLGQFAATEAEFRTLYPLFTSTLQTTGETDGHVNPGEARRAREAAERQLDEHLRRVLGPARYAEMQEANDHLLQQTRAFTTSLNLPAHVATEVIAVQKEYGPQLIALDRDRDLTPNQRDARVSALGLEARDRLLRALGPAGFERYKRQGGGWLGAALNRTPPTASPAP
jgi:hypothetical protein